MPVITTTTHRPNKRRRTPIHRSASAKTHEADRQERSLRHPISRWYLCPAAGWLAAALTATRVRPVQLTWCGLVTGVGAAVVLLWQAELAPAAAVLVLSAWFFDRADGQLARRQQTVSAWGAWLDANVDELLDVAWHVAVAAAAARSAGSSAAWLLLVAFLSGKYLFMHGLVAEQNSGESSETPPGTTDSSTAMTRLRRVYHLPGNADVRVHLLALALFTGWLTAELAVVAVYYNLRWIVRYVLVARRLERQR